MYKLDLLRHIVHLTVSPTTSHLKKQTCLYYYNNIISIQCRSWNPFLCAHTLYNGRPYVQFRTDIYVALLGFCWHMHGVC